MKAKKPINIERVLARVRYFLENMDSLLLRQQDPHRKAQLFGALFDQLPTYADLDYGTQKTPIFTGVNPIFSLLADDNFPLVSSRVFGWNTLEDDLIQLYRNLVELGVEYHDGKVYLADLEEDDV